MTDQDAIHLLRQGSERERSRALAYVRGEFLPMYYSILKKRGVRDPEKALLHETIVVLFQKVRQQEFKLTAKLTNFLYSICDKITLKYLRKRGQEVKREDIDEVTEEVIIDFERENRSMEDALSVSTNAQWYDTIREEIKRLGSPCQEILFAYYFHREKLKEIGRELSFASDIAIRQKKFKCIERLRKRLNDLLP